jgi:hypothetical protein
LPATFNLIGLVHGPTVGPRLLHCGLVRCFLILGSTTYNVNQIIHNNNNTRTYTLVTCWRWGQCAAFTITLFQRLLGISDPSVGCVPYYIPYYIPSYIHITCNKEYYILTPIYYILIFITCNKFFMHYLLHVCNTKSYYM